MEALMDIMNYTSLFLNGSSDFLDRNFSFWNSTGVAHESQGHSPYYGEYLTIFRNSYGSIHGYLSFNVCMFGITANILNIIVLTRKNMVSPTNAILTGLAVADMLVMFSYLPFTFHNYIRNDLSEKEKFSYAWAVFTLFHAHFTVVNHTISIWLTVTVAIWRFMAVSFPASSANLCSMPRAKTAIMATYAACTIFCIPVYITFTVSGIQGTNGDVMYRVDFSEIAQRHDKTSGEDKLLALQRHHQAGTVCGSYGSEFGSYTCALRDQFEKAEIEK
ncbi:sex peptide receptor [Caerostris extrusa]|uniref:Sex peptide receptor n=1 Tax=Caerostris extrusa TaxID=172846 RepID=A0AAV4PY67_CAEEX|nr:sex peptide receptor [Caerostris extrusa]